MQVKVNDISYSVDTSKNESFWQAVNAGTWEPEIFEIFDRHIDERTVMFDIGSWIGPTAMYGVQLAKACVAFEPDPIAFENLKANVEINSKSPWRKKLFLENKAVSSDGAEFVMGSQGAGGDSTSSALFNDQGTTWVVQACTLDDAISKYATNADKIFLKIDIEGGEYDLLPSIKHVLADNSVSAHLSLHPQYLKKKLMGGKINPLEFLKGYAEVIKLNMGILNSLPSDKKVTFYSGKKGHKNKPLLLPYALILVKLFVSAKLPREITIVPKAG